MEARYREVAQKYAPAFIKLRYKRKKDGKVVLKPAHACLQREEILTPRPDTLWGLVYFLHECAHFHLRHFDSCEANSPKMAHLYSGGATETVAQQEYEAEQWTISTLRREGISVPDEVIRDMRRYVRQCLVKKETVPHRVRKFARK